MTWLHSSESNTNFFSCSNRSNVYVIGVFSTFIKNRDVVLTGIRRATIKHEHVVKASISALQERKPSSSETAFSLLF